MEKYNTKLINDYINGKEIDEYKLSELENDKLFMKKVIYLSNDENMYNLCSDNLKKDYDFVKYIILKFKYNVKFIITVADYFLENTDTDLERMELVLIMKDLTQNTSDGIKYKITSELIYTSKRMEIEMFKKNQNDKRISDEIGMGFLLFFASYNSSEIVLNFYATKIIEDIFYSYNINLEKNLHSRFKTPEQINEYGLNKYMIDFISLYDKMLSSYLCSHLNLLSSQKNKIIAAQKNWDNYNKIEEEKKYRLIIENAYNYMAEVDGIFTETYLLYYVAKQFGVAEKLAKYDGISNDIYDDIMNSLSDDFVKDTFDTSFIDIVHYHNICKIFNNILFEKNNKYGADTVGAHKKCKLLKIDFNKKKK